MGWIFVSDLTGHFLQGKTPEVMPLLMGEEYDDFIAQLAAQLETGILVNVVTPWPADINLSLHKIGCQAEYHVLSAEGQMYQFRKSERPQIVTHDPRDPNKIVLLTISAN